MTVSERDRHAIGLQGREPVDGIADKARFGLLAVADHGRPGGLEALNRVANGSLKQGSRHVLRDPASGELPHACDEFGGSRNTANRLGGNRHAGNAIGGSRTLSNGKRAEPWDTMDSQTSAARGFCTCGSGKHHGKTPRKANSRGAQVDAADSLVRGPWLSRASRCGRGTGRLLSQRALANREDLDLPSS